MRAYEVRYITEHVITILAESIEDAQVRAKCVPADDWDEVSSRYDIAACQEFRIALDAYRIALESGTSAQIVGTSIRVYCAKAGVPKSWHPLVNRMFRETARIK